LSDEEFNSWQKKLVAAIIIALVGGNAGFFLNKTIPDARFDPFTGSEGAVQEKRLDVVESTQKTMLYRMKRQEVWRDECRITVQDHLRHHP
jgi:hypothetical protein